MNPSFTGVEAKHHLPQADDVEGGRARSFQGGKQMGHARIITARQTNETATECALSGTTRRVPDSLEKATHETLSPARRRNRLLGRPAIDGLPRWPTGTPSQPA
jgi:hypothetical protein